MNMFKAPPWFFMIVFFLSCAGPVSLDPQKPGGQTTSPNIQAIDRHPILSSGKQGQNYVEGQVIVKFREGTGKDAIEAMMRELHLEIIRTFSRPNLYLMRIPDKTDVKGIVERLKTYPAVEYAEPNFKVTID